MQKNHSVRVSPRLWGRGSATKEQPLGNYFEVRFRTEKYVVTYFSAESEAKQSDLRKEAASARAASSPRRVEALNGGDPELAERGRRPFKPQTVLLRQTPPVASNPHLAEQGSQRGAGSGYPKRK